MSECRPRGNPGGTQGSPNQAPMTGPKHMDNSSASAPAGERQKPNPLKQVPGRKGHSIR